MRSTRLGEFQAQFREFLYRGRHEENLAGQVRSLGCTSPNDRLDVYRNAYFIRLEAALAHDFPVTEKILGKKNFARCAADYALANPSGSPSLREFGHRFANWLRAEESPMLGDLAAIEWAALNVFDGPDANAADAQRLHAFTPEEWPSLHIRLMPTLTLLTLGSNADRVWLEKGEGIELEAAPVHYIAIWRGEQYRPMLVGVDTDNHAVLDIIAREPELAVASERLAEELDPASVPRRIATALHRALAHGWIASIEIGHSFADEPRY
ncbi:MAG TPA: DNA-binding domain-containing protein [Woeseiaceae bacterium]|nr:DNA-binding domain-containing protein [Woeseiaceae bacterium]